MTNYSLKDYGFMIGPRNRNRVDAFYRALKQVITPESVVVEIGTGVGFFALLACQLGAKHVYAIEPNHRIALGRELAQANGYADRITFFEALSSDVVLPELADVMLSDIHGSLPWVPYHISAIRDGRQRFLKPGGVQIPLRDTVWAAVVNCPRLYQKQMGPWQDNPYGLDLSAGRLRAVNGTSKTYFRAADLLTTAQQWATLDYPAITETDAHAHLEWEIETAGLAHGVAVWFEGELLPDIILSNAPDQPVNPVYGQTFFPWEQPTFLDYGDRVEVTIDIYLMNNGRYGRDWVTTISDANRVVKARFQQSLAKGTIKEKG